MASRIQEITVENGGDTTKLSSVLSGVNKEIRNTRPKANTRAFQVGYYNEMVSLIRNLFYELVEDWFRKVTQSDTERINRFCAAFPADDMETIQEMSGDYLWDSISMRDTAVRRNMKENFYHGMFWDYLGVREAGWLSPMRKPVKDTVIFPYRHQNALGL